MDGTFLTIGFEVFALAAGVSFLAGTVKGMVGFALPMIMISGLSSLLPPETALAALILPTVAANGMQAFRHGAGALWGLMRDYRVFLFVGAVFLIASAQLVRFVSGVHLLFVLGVVVAVFSAVQLLGWQPRITGPRGRIEAGFAAVAGAIGGISGVWGPPTVMFLSLLDVSKRESLRLQGLIYGLGAVLLLISHLGSGILNRETLPLSAALVVPALAGLGLGMALGERIDQRGFRRLTQAVLLLAGLNLIRRALVG